MGDLGPLKSMPHIEKESYNLKKYKKFKKKKERKKKNCRVQSNKFMSQN